MTIRVRVVYIIKHIHAFNLLNISIIRAVYPGGVYVWRLILKNHPNDYHANRSYRNFIENHKKINPKKKIKHINRRLFEKFYITL